MEWRGVPIAAIRYCDVVKPVIPSPTLEQRGLLKHAFERFCQCSCSCVCVCVKRNSIGLLSTPLSAYCGCYKTKPNIIARELLVLWRKSLIFALSVNCFRTVVVLEYLEATDDLDEPALRNLSYTRMSPLTSSPAVQKGLVRRDSKGVSGIDKKACPCRSNHDCQQGSEQSVDKAPTEGGPGALVHCRRLHSAGGRGH
uniref:Uncharacterized protein n=1 Tax=Timema douglasi TaxID=61478 RepID=A0A7R8Z7W3_TIMDO|nr:unnamed protein product [Timema douglasi]